MRDCASSLSAKRNCLPACIIRRCRALAITLLKVTAQFLVMQFIPGDDLAQMMARKQGPFPPDQVIAWGDQLLDALITCTRRIRRSSTATSNRTI